ncbi:MAG: hypothetical protein LBS99_01765 [Clostridiales bacterium]|jgi:hypothetical protein|nr:hypothetical protein [Clostridiales bacterium]
MDCLIYDRECVGCGECLICDLDANKVCDNCCKCIESDKPYSEILVGLPDKGEVGKSLKSLVGKKSAKD